MKIIIIAMIVLLLVGIFSVAAFKDNSWQYTDESYNKYLYNSKWTSYNSDDFKGSMKNKYGKHSTYNSGIMNPKFGKHPDFKNKNMKHKFGKRGDFTSVIMKHNLGKYGDFKNKIIKQKFVKQKYEGEVVVVWPSGNKEVHKVYGTGYQGCRI